MPKVIITDGPGAGEEFPIERAVIAGRLPSNGIPLKDKKSSREHAKIYKQGQDYAIVDLNSSNGTEVNGQKVTKRVLKDGDEIVIGTVTMRFELLEADKPKPKVERKSMDAAFEEATSEERTGAQAAPAAGGDGGVQLSASHKPLQFNKVSAGRNMFGFDLSQMSDTAQLLTKLGIFVLFLLIAWFSYNAATG